jgi:ubiquinone/menaquinone biosynthesis C-methylase UbiE
MRAIIPQKTITRSDDYVEYCRETAKHARELHDLALRGRDQKETTKVVHERIVEAVELSADDELVDVGCGDGTLLRMARDLGIRKATGILPTDEEVSLLRKTGLEVERGFTDRLPLPDEIASVVVCNNVLLVVPCEKISQSFRELARIAKRGARVYAGEIPFAQHQDPTPIFNSRRELLSHLYHKRGLRTWLGMVRRMIWWRLTGQSAVVRPGTAVSFFASPEEVIELAEAAGLKLIRYWRHSNPDTRNNYLFRKT